jgi:TolB protein
MAHDVFLSYSSIDKSIADTLCAKLEENGIRVWIAPRDVPPGANFAEAIVTAIQTCQVFVLLWSANSSASKHILNEINQAFDQNIPIIPFRIQDVKPSGAMSYYLNNTHWLDAFDPSWESHLNRLIQTVSANLALQPEDLRPAPPAAAPPPQTAVPPRQQPRKKSKLPGILLGGLGAALLLLGGWYGLTHWKWNGPPAGPQAPAAEQTPQEEPAPADSETPSEETLLPTETLAAETETPAEPSQEIPPTLTAADPCQIVFGSSRTGELHLWGMNPDGSNQTQLTFNPFGEFIGSWTPDGAEFIFFSWRDGDSEIYIMDKSGSNIRQLTQNDFSDVMPKLAPDGRTIAFYSDRTGSSEIYLMNLDGSDQRQLTTSYGWYGTNYEVGITASLDWSPDGGSLVFVSDREGTPDLFTFSASLGESSPETINHLGEGGETSFELEPAWSPDGTRIAFVSDRYGDYEIFLFNADGSGISQLTSNNGISSQPAWSPKGDRIAFTSNRSGDSEIWIMNADGSNPQQVTFSEGYDGAPIWSPLCK